jgi:hypothetical protein
MAPGVIKVLESFKKVVKVIKSSKSSKSSKGSKGSGEGWGPGPGRAQPGPPRLAQQSPGVPPQGQPREVEKLHFKENQCIPRYCRRIIP